MKKPTLDDLDLARLIRARIGEQGKTISEVARVVYDKREGLTNVLSGTKSVSPVSFLKLVKLLGVRGSLLRLWTAAYLVSRSPEFLWLVRETGLVDRAPPVTDTTPAKESEQWRVYSREEQTGRRRHAVSSYLKRHPGARSRDIADELRISPMLVRSSLHDMRESGLVRFRQVTAEVEGLHSSRKAKVGEWFLTENGESLLLRSEAV